jgi:hypothetical protein
VRTGETASRVTLRGRSGARATHTAHTPLTHYVISRKDRTDSLPSRQSDGVCLSTTASTKQARQGRDRSGGCAASWRRPPLIRIPHTVRPSSRGAWYTSELHAYTSVGRSSSGAEASLGWLMCHQPPPPAPYSMAGHGRPRGRDRGPAEACLSYQYAYE